VEANRKFLRRDQAESDALFAELDVKIEAEDAGAEKPELAAAAHAAGAGHEDRREGEPMAWATAAKGSM